MGLLEIGLLYGHYRGRGGRVEARTLNVSLVTLIKC